MEDPETLRHTMDKVIRSALNANLTGSMKVEYSLQKQPKLVTEQPRGMRHQPRDE